MDGKNEKRLFSVVFYLSLILGALVCAGLNKMTIAGMMVQICYALIIGIAFMTLLHAREDMLWHQIPEKLIYLFSFSAALCLIGVSSRYHVGLFWLLPLIAVGTVRQIEIKAVTFGVLMADYLCNSLLVNKDIEAMIYNFVMAAAFLMIMSMLHKRQEIPYAGVIIVALSLAMYVIHCGFNGREMFAERYYILLEISGLIFLMLFGMILYLTMGNLKEEDSAYDPDADSVRAEMPGEAADGNGQSEEDSLMLYLQEDFPLIMQLQERQDLYRHCHEISRLSGLAAEKLGYDAVLASAAGMFHEAGRLIDPDNYMEGNRELAKQYQFPEQLIQVIRQHNTGSEIPKSPEAAIVMLCDCIISTSEYLSKNGKRNVITDDKLITSIFANRMEKGSLAEAGMTSDELEQLKEFFIAHAFEMA